MANILTLEELREQITIVPDFQVRKTLFALLDYVVECNKTNSCSCEPAPVSQVVTPKAEVKQPEPVKPVAPPKPAPTVATPTAPSTGSPAPSATTSATKEEDK